MAISLNLENPKLFGKGYKTVYNLHSYCTITQSPNFG